MMMMSDAPSTQKGLTLAEVLVTVLVLSIGLVGMAGLQATAIKSNYSALYRTQATALAADIADRMRANRTAALKGRYDLDDLVNAHASSASRADKDLHEWLAQVAQLPLGKARIQRDGNSAVVTITIEWDDRRGAIEKAGARATSSDIEEMTRFIYRTVI